MSLLILPDVKTRKTLINEIENRLPKDLTKYMPVVRQMKLNGLVLVRELLDVITQK